MGIMEKKLETTVGTHWGNIRFILGLHRDIGVRAYEPARRDQCFGHRPMLSEGVQGNARAQRKSCGT